MKIPSAETSQNINSILMPGGWFWATILVRQMNFLLVFRMPVVILLCCTAFSLTSAGAQAATARSRQVTHVMLFWLKRPGNVDDQNFLLRALRTLRRVRGVNDVRVGRSLPVARPGLEQSFDLGVVMIFRDREALEKFERDQRREQAIDAMLRPLVRQYTVYNFVNE